MTANELPSRWGDDTSIDPPCLHCQHLTAIGDQALDDWFCPAFPEGIPFAILARQVNHKDPVDLVPGQAAAILYVPKVYRFDGGLVSITYEGERKEE